MGAFRVQAVDAHGRRARWVMEGESEDAVREQVEAHPGWRVERVVDAAGATPSRGGAAGVDARFRRRFLMWAAVAAAAFVAIVALRLAAL